MHVLADVARMPVLGLLIDIGALVSLFAGTLGCITAAARVLLLMAHNGLTHGSFRATHARNETPSGASSSLARRVLPVAILGGSRHRAAWTSMAGWARWLPTDSSSPMALVCFALPRYLRDHRHRQRRTKTIPWLAFLAMMLALAAIFIRCPRDLTASCHISTWRIWPWFFCGFCSTRARKPLRRANHSRPAETRLKLSFRGAQRRGTCFALRVFNKADPSPASPTRDDRFSCYVSRLRALTLVVGSI